MLLPLDSPEWLQVTPFLGKPEEVPALLQMWLQKRDGRALSELLQYRLSAQGSLTVAAAAATPYLIQGIEAAALPQQLEILHFLSLVALGGFKVDERWRDEFEAALRRAHALTTTILESPAALGGTPLESADGETNRKVRGRRSDIPRRGGATPLANEEDHPGDPR